MNQAVYIVIVDDTQVNDTFLAVNTSSIVRLGGNLPPSEAEALSREIDSAFWLNDEFAPDDATE